MNLAPPDSQQLILRRHPFDQAHGVFPVRAGQTLGAMLREGAQSAELSEMIEVRIGGIEVPRSLWDKVTPKPGAEVFVTGKVAGSGGWRQVLMIVVAAIATWVTGGAAAGTLGAAFAGGTVGAALLGAGVMIVGTLAVNALIPPPKPQSNAATEGRFNALTGSQNGINPYGPIPFVIGESRFYPPHAAMPYSQSVGEASYQYCMFDLGFLTPGAVVDDLRIGDTPIADFDQVQYEITTAPTLYTNDVSESFVGAAMEGGDSVERTTAPGVDSISLDIIFPQGLFGVGESGGEFAMHVLWNIEYRAVGDTTWITPGYFDLRRSGLYNDLSFPGYLAVYGDRKKPFAVGVSWDVPNGQYEVRVKRTNSPLDDSRNTHVYTAQWSVLRSITHVNPSTTGTHKLVMRIKATDQLNGTLQTLSCRVRQSIPVWDRATDTWTDELTCNTGWVYHWLLTQCPAIAKHVPASRVNLEQIADYADYCTLHELETRMVCDARSTVRDLLERILAGSLGTIGMTNGQYGVVFDSGDNQSSMSFTQKESKGFTATRVFTRIPHALRVRFTNPDANWEQDEIVVLDDGYSYRGMDARGNASGAPEPTLYETMDLQMACYAQQAWRLGRMHFAQAKYRATVYGWETDIAGMGCARGDVVDVTSDVTEWGAGAGVVVGVNGTTVTLDTEIKTQAGKSYRAQIRRVDTDGVVIVSESYAVTPHSPASATLYFDTAPTLAVGDMVIVGESGNVTATLILTGITSANDLGFGMRAVAYDSRVAPFWANPPESIISEISGRELENPDPPTVIGVISDPINDTTDDAGITSPEVHIGIGGEPGFKRPPDFGRPRFAV